MTSRSPTSRPRGGRARRPDERAQQREEADRGDLLGYGQANLRAGSREGRVPIVRRRPQRRGVHAGAARGADRGRPPHPGHARRHGLLHDRDRKGAPRTRRGSRHRARDGGRDEGARGQSRRRQPGDGAGGCHNLPFRTGTFAAILCPNGLQVMPGLGRALGEMARVLAPNGVLYASVVHLPIGALLPSLAGRLPTVLAARRSLTNAFENAGLQVTSIRKHRLATLVEARKPA
jgi:SAM-dependent methyltransferase